MYIVWYTQDMAEGTGKDTLYSRRDLFKRYAPNAPRTNTEPHPINEIPKITLTRKQFLRFAAGLGSALTTKPNEARAAQPLSNRSSSILSPTAELKRFFEEKRMNPKEYAKTMIEQSLVTAGNAMFVSFMRRRYPIPAATEDLSVYESKLREETIRENEVREFIDKTIETPLVEEFVHRLIGSKIATGLGVKGTGWQVGIPISAIFALRHHLSEEGNETQVNIGPSSLPQFMNGVFLWYLMREKGFSHAVLGHALNNAAGDGVVKILDRAFPKKGAMSSTSSPNPK